MPSFKHLLSRLKNYQADNEKGELFNLFNFLYFVYRRNNWMLDLRRYWKDFEDVEINQPVFVLGFHGGGTSLLSRMIRRNKKFVSVSGNYKYWSGADEMQAVLGPVLPSELTGVTHNIPEEANLKPPTGWIYAADEYLPYFRKKAADVTPEAKEKFRKIVRWQIARHAVNKKTARFTDKSQIFTIKVSFINEILKDTNPKFILLVRNPYALCRPRNKNMERNGIKDDKDQLRLACQHYKNSVKCAWEDSKEADLKTVKFEKLLSQPKETLKDICGFAKIDFSERMIPHAEDKVCFGSTGRNKWYPLRPDVNKKHFEKLTEKKASIIEEELGSLIQQLGYNKPEL